MENSALVQSWVPKSHSTLLSARIGDTRYGEKAAHGHCAFPQASSQRLSLDFLDGGGSEAAAQGRSGRRLHVPSAPLSITQNAYLVS